MVGAPNSFNNETQRLGKSLKCDSMGDCTDLTLKLNYTTWESNSSWMEHIYDKMMFGFAMDANHGKYMASGLVVYSEAKN